MPKVTINVSPGLKKKLANGLLAIAARSPEKAAEELFEKERARAEATAAAHYRDLVLKVGKTLAKPLMKGIKDGGMLINIVVQGKAYAVRGVKTKTDWRPLNKAYARRKERSTTFWWKTGDLAEAYKAMQDGMPLFDKAAYRGGKLVWAERGPTRFEACFVIRYPKFPEPNADQLIRHSFALAREQHIPDPDQSRRKEPLLHLALANKRRPWVGGLSGRVGQAMIEKLEAGG